jgi:serine/threonine protein kinase/Tol biopolymer transport system component
MTPERWRQISDIFHAAIDRDWNSRERFLEDACRHDPALRAEVDALVAAHGAAGSFGHALDATMTLPAGTQLGFYEIQELIGAGGMGDVYRARDTRLGRDVAIKVLPPAFTQDRDRLTRFEREARVLASLNHPNIATIHGIEESGDIHALVMELVEGRTLAETIDASGVLTPSALVIARQIAGALATAHQKGIVHRDLKPANVKLRADGVVKVLDFGLAKVFGDTQPDDSATVTSAGTHGGAVLGTPAYMSPEQARGQPVDARTDVWAFGCVLYEMLTRTRAFRGETATDTLAAVIHKEPDWNLLPGSSPDRVKQLLQRCLQKDPTRRLRDMADIGIQLDEPPVPVVSPRAQTRVRVRRTWPWLAAAVAVLLLIGGAFAWRAWRGPGDTEPLRAVPLTSFRGAVRAPSLSPDGTHMAFSWNGDQHTNFDIYVQQIGAGDPIQLTKNPANDYGPSWSPDGRTIAFLRRESSAGSIEVRLIPPLGGPERKLADIHLPLLSGQQNSVSWCPDSTCVVVSDAPAEGKPDAVFAIDLDTTQKRQLTFPEGRVTDTFPVVSPDGRALIFLRKSTPTSGVFYRLPLKDHFTPDGQPIALTAPLRAGQAAWLPNGREILFHGRSALWRLDALKGGTPSRLLTIGQDGYTPTVAPMADGSVRLVYGHSYSDLNVWRVDTPAAGTPASSAPVAAIVSTREDSIASLSPDGTHAAFLSDRSGEFEAWVAAIDGSSPVPLTAPADNPGFPRWSPKGDQIVFHADPHARADVFSVSSAGGMRPRLLTLDTLGGAFPSFSRDGNWIYFSQIQSGGNRTILKMPASGGRPVQVTRDHGTMPIESYDQDYLYFVEATDRPSPVFRVPLPNGTPSKALEGVVVVNGAYDVVERGIYYIDQVSGDTGAFYSDLPGGETRLRYYDFATNRSITVANNLGMVYLGLSASRDGRTILYTRIDSAVEELMLVDKFR